MRRIIAVTSLLVLSACAATTSSPLGPGKEMEAVRDFIIASELIEVDRIRLSEPIKYLYVNDSFVVIPTRRADFLVELRGRCIELRKRKYTSDMIDIRVSARVLHSDYDTIRGCKIDRIYELPEPRLTELAELGDAPGDEVFMPEDE